MLLPSSSVIPKLQKQNFGHLSIKRKHWSLAACHMSGVVYAGHQIVKIACRNAYLVPCTADLVGLWPVSDEVSPHSSVLEQSWLFDLFQCGSSRFDGLLDVLHPTIPRSASGSGGVWLHFHQRCAVLLGAILLMWPYHLSCESSINCRMLLTWSSALMSSFRSLSLLVMPLMTGA